MRHVLDALELLRVLSIEDQVAFEVVDLEVRIRARARAAVVIERIVAVSRIQRLETPRPRAHEKRGRSPLFHRPQAIPA